MLEHTIHQLESKNLTKELKRRDTMVNKGMKHPAFKAAQKKMAAKKKAPGAKKANPFAKRFAKKK